MLALAIGLGALMLQTPPARRWVQAKVTQFLASENITFDSDELQYSLFGLSLEMRNLGIVSPLMPDAPPFLTVEHARIDLSSWQLLRGRYVIESGRLEGVKLHYFVNQSGADNLPRPPRDPDSPREPLNFLIADLQIPDAEVRYENLAQDIDAVFPRVQLSGAAPATFTLVGTVTESAPTTSTLLAGAMVRFVDGANQGKSAITGADGRYEISGLSAGGYTVSATLAGYASATLPVGIDGTTTTLNFRLDPLAARTRFGPGQYRVGADMPAGIYYSDPGHGCRFQRLRGFGGTTADAITATQVNFDAAQWVVQVLATDAGFETDSACSFWYTTPRRGLASNIAAGLWVVGIQVTPGTYRTENAAVGCEWQRVSAFTGAPEAVIAGSFVSAAGPQIVTIAATDAGFSTMPECGTWTRTGS